MKVQQDLERAKLRLHKDELELQAKQHQLEVDRHQASLKKERVLVQLAKQPIFLAFIGAIFSLILGRVDSRVYP